MTRNLFAPLAYLSYYSTSYLPPAIIVMFRSVLTNVQQQNALFPLETHTVLLHRNGYITFVTSRVAAIHYQILSYTESSVRTWRDKYLQDLQIRQEEGREMVEKKLPYKKEIDVLKLLTSTEIDHTSCRYLR